MKLVLLPGIGIPRVSGSISQVTAPWGTSLRAGEKRTGHPGPLFCSILSLRSRLSNIWQANVTPAQKISWSAYATANPVPKENGRIVTLQNWNWFLKVNLTSVHLGLGVRLSPPPFAPPGTARLIDATPLAGALIRYQWDNSLPWTKNVAYYAVLLDYGPCSPASHRSKKFCRYAAVNRGIPIVGYPLPLVAVRPFVNTIPSTGSFRSILHRDY